MCERQIYTSTSIAMERSQSRSQSVAAPVADASHNDVPRCYDSANLFTQVDGSRHMLTHL